MATIQGTKPDYHENKAKKVRKGFSIGPENLPDGAHKRKVQRIKQDIVRKAKIKKSYQKLKEREKLGVMDAASNDHSPETHVSASLELHPQRQAMLEEPGVAPAQQKQSTPRPWQRRPSRPKPAPFHKEALLAQQRREERERRQVEIQKANRQRQAKSEERERFRKAMAKARSGGKNGKRKLGLESKVLLEKVQRMMAD